ncbi:MAG: sulfurtransferase [Nitrosopumilales archaeon]|nr:sulfurtransferase [Nitrosopumilales archaeon]
MLIQTSELEKTLDDSNLVIIDARSFKEYLEGHIPGAVNLDLFAFHWFDTTKEGIESFNKQMQQLFSFVGITNEKKVIFYDEVSGMLAARGVWLLMYFSHPQTFMLDGGMKKWKKEMLPLETKANCFKPAKFSGKINSELVASFEYIKKNLDQIQIIDARSHDEYDCTIIRAARKGHIPTAINVDWNLNVADDGTLKKDNDLLALYKIPKDSEVVTYCQGAYRAANAFLALKKIGFKKVRVYLGSWAEWANRLELSVE